MGKVVRETDGQSTTRYIHRIAADPIPSGSQMPATRNVLRLMADPNGDAHRLLRTFLVMEYCARRNAFRSSRRVLVV